eukprot:gene24935-biopygen20936
MPALGDKVLLPDVLLPARLVTPLRSDNGLPTAHANSRDFGFPMPLSTVVGLRGVRSTGSRPPPPPPPPPKGPPPVAHAAPRSRGNRTLARAWRGHGAGVARAIGSVWLGVARAWRWRGAGICWTHIAFCRTGVLSRCWLQILSWAATRAAISYAEPSRVARTSCSLFHAVPCCSIRFSTIEHDSYDSVQFNTVQYDAMRFKVILYNALRFGLEPVRFLPVRAIPCAPCRSAGMVGQGTPSRFSCACCSCPSAAGTTPYLTVPMLELHSQPLESPQGGGHPQNDFEKHPHVQSEPHLLRIKNPCFAGGSLFFATPCLVAAQKCRIFLRNALSSKTDPFVFFELHIGLLLGPISESIQERCTQAGTCTE